MVIHGLVTLKLPPFWDSTPYFCPVIKEFNQDGEKAFPDKGHSKEEELRQLQRENQRLKQTVEILEPIYERMRSKKAMGILELPIKSCI